MAALQRLRSPELGGLLEWYAKNQRDFPWRRNPEPYWVWLAEIMSQQTQMATLVPYFYRFVERFPSVAALAAASEEEVLSAWTGLGYYSRARNIHAAAQQIARGGEFPRTPEDWLALPGVGPYTAAAVVSQCWGVEEPVWDGNVIRVCSRLDARGDARDAAFRAEMLAALREKMRGRDASCFNQALMELGATVCTPKAPACGRCPIERACAARARGEVEKFPPPKPRKEQVELKCRVWVILRQVSGSYEGWLERRSENHWFGGMWDFPSELGGSGAPLAGVPRSVAREAGEPFGLVRHQIMHHKILLEGRLVLAASGEKRGAGRWIHLDDLTSEKTPVPLSTTARKVLKALLRGAQIERLARSRTLC